MYLRKVFISGVIIAFFLAFAYSPLRAQSTSALQGVVNDQSGGFVPNAKVVVKNQDTGVERITQTDHAGSYQVSSLPVGNYQVEIQADGFQTQVIKNIKLEVNKTSVQNVQLKIGGVSDVVNVSAEGTVVESTTITVGQVIDQKTVQEIPLNGRHFVDLGLLIPGSVTPPQNGFLTRPLRGQGSFAFNTAGNREDTVNFMINGINLNDMVQNQITFQPSINTVQEFKADNSTFSAEFGRNSGAIVNIATRSGSNEFHGEAFEFIRNNALDARNFFDATKGPFKRNQFGGALGGPILKDHTFFFFSYEGLRQRQGITINSGVLSDAERARVLNDPTTHPTTRRLLDFIPRANAFDVASRFQGSSTAPVNIDQWTGDVSHALTADDRLHGYYAIQRDKRGEPTLEGTTIPNFGDTRQSRRQIFTLNETHTFSPSLVNEARLGFNRIHITFTPNVRVNPADFGINNGVNAPVGLPRIIINSINLDFGGPINFPQGRGDTTVVLSDTANYLHGRHSIKAGGEFRRFYNNNFTADTGRFRFTTVNDFIMGTANNFDITLGNRSSSIATGALGFYVQDSFKWQTNLTLEMGLRYDWLMVPTERNNRFIIFDPVSASLIQVGSGINQIYHTNKANLQPRVGFAWDPFNDGKTSLRGAYAILVDQPVTNSLGGLPSNPPLATPLVFSGPIRFDNAAQVARASGLAPSTIDQGFDNPYVQSWNLNLQRELMPALGVMIGYFGSKGTHLRLARNLNQFVNGVRPFQRVAANSPLLPGTLLGNITQVASGGNSSYNALWITADKRLSRGFQFNASYTWSKSIDYNSLSRNVIDIQDSYNFRGDRALSDYDARHRFVASWLYELPFRGNQIVEGWQVTGIAQLQGGNPVNIVTDIPNLTGIANTLRPDVAGNVNMLRDRAQWFSNSVCDPRNPGSCPPNATFVIPVSTVGGGSVFHFGNLGRNAIIGPRFANFDFSILKNTKLAESVKFQFRVEIFDLFNHANFGQPRRIAVAGSRSFGVIEDTRTPTGDSGSSRQLQFAMKLLF